VVGAIGNILKRRDTTLLWAVALLLVVATAWNRVRAPQDAALGLYYLPILLAAVAFSYVGALSTALLALGGAYLSTLARGAGRPDIWLDLPGFFVCGTVAAALFRQCGALEDASTRDSLTGLLDRATFTRLLSEVLQNGTTGTVLLLDLDGFTHLNGQLGRTRCDAFLRDVAALIVNSTRLEDVTARYGADEFVVLLPDTAPDAATIVTERIRKAIVQCGVNFDVKLTCAIGAVGIEQPGPTDAGTILSRADEALFEARRFDGNRVVFYDPEMGGAR
jgi:diguanylate cyclase (GGDEF)-like protein